MCYFDKPWIRFFYFSVCLFLNVISSGYMRKEVWTDLTCDCVAQSFVLFIVDQNFTEFYSTSPKMLISYKVVLVKRDEREREKYGNDV